MIKSVINEESSSDYPKLMIGSLGTVMLMSGDGVGVILLADDSDRVGEMCTSIVMSTFTDFNGSITLSNGGK